jgi:hypothetical protein
MKLAEALALRSDLAKRLASVQRRTVASARVQEGETPAEDPAALVAEFERMANDHTDLVGRINRTNLAVTLPSGQSVTAAIAERDRLKLVAGFYREVASAATLRQDRVTRSEVRYVTTVDVRALRERSDDAAKAYRELDTALQAQNWAADLLD